MDKQAQDKLWNELSEESKKFVKSLYYDVKDPNRELYDYEDRAQKELLESICGEHNLNPKPQIKTWEDVLIHYPQYSTDSIDESLFYLGGGMLSDKLRKKIYAVIKIAKLIELGYGGMMSEEDKVKPHFAIFPIVNSKKLQVVDSTLTNVSGRDFVSFYNGEQAEEFMSHESNRKLVEQYYMM